MEQLQPLSAMGFFHVTSKLEVYQSLIFEYFDPESYYSVLVEDEEELEKELKRLAAVMQDFLDEEEVIINGERVKPRVRAVDVGFKGSPDEVFITYFIFFKGKPLQGLNYYENLYENETAEYPITAYWVFPPGSKIVNVQMSGDVIIISPNVLSVRLEEGEKIYGYEKIEFELPMRRAKQ
ncbi:MAG: hypothetical protein ACP5II_03445 [Infirmifilum sp.]|uniref:hypothetical protein n=1 Tax=Infirmifilum sp. TaxID=2856575 RepID=UPI002357170D